MTTEYDGEAPAAGIARRLACMAYEALLLLGVLAALFLLPQMLIAIARGAPQPGIVLLPHAFVVVLVYFLWFWRHGGQTLAMKTWKIRLVAARRGAAPTLTQLLVRHTLSWLTLCYGLAIWWALFDRDRQFLHDRLAGTRLVLA
jgi:uncharacterized RDD family membrane protein YckC